MGIPDHLTCLLWNLYAGQEATVRTEHGTMDWFQTGKRVNQNCILSPCLFNLYADYIMWNAGLDEVQPGINIARRKRRAGWSTSWNQHCWEKYQPQICRWHHPMAESEGELNSLLMKVKEESEKAGLKLNIQKTKIMASSPITLWQIDAETMETVRSYFWGLQNHCRWWLQPWN